MITLKTLPLIGEHRCDNDNERESFFVLFWTIPMKIFSNCVLHYSKALLQIGWTAPYICFFPSFWFSVVHFVLVIYENMKYLVKLNCYALVYHFFLLSKQSERIERQRRSYMDVSQKVSFIVLDYKIVVSHLYQLHF